MSTQNVEETLPTSVQPDSQKKRRSRIGWIFLGILMILVLGGAGAYGGYQTAMEDRLAYSATQVGLEAAKQYQLGEIDQQEGRLELARRRFERVIQLSPNFPGAAEHLTQVMLKLSVTNTPTPNPTPTLTPTPDLRGAEALFNQARQDLAAENWQGAFDTLEALRKEDITYHTIDVDGMYYVALRNLGMKKITEGSLEMGMYDLSLAERFGYLDGQALGLRVVTRLYLTGASFWEVDWAQASYFFEQVFPYYPGLRDASGMSARERFRFATLKFADQLVVAHDYCNAVSQYEKVTSLGLDPTVEPTLQEARDLCAGPQPEQPQATQVSPSPTVESGGGVTPAPVITDTPAVIETTPPPPVETVEPPPAAETP